MSSVIIFGVVCAVVIGLGKLILKVIREESVPPHAAAMNEAQSLQHKNDDMFDFGNINYQYSIHKTLDD